MEAWSAWRQRIERYAAERDACRTELETLAGQEKLLAEEMSLAETAFTQTAEQYEEWLRERRLPEGLSRKGCRISSLWWSRGTSCCAKRISSLYV